MTENSPTAANTTATSSNAETTSAQNAGYFIPGSTREAAIDDLCCGATTLRDENGAVPPDRLGRLTLEERERLICSEYGRDEVFPEVSVPATVDLTAVDCGYVNGCRVHDLRGGEWRDLVSAGLPVEAALAGLVYDLLRNEIQRLSPHLLHALQRRPHVIKLAGERMVRALHRGESF